MTLAMVNVSGLWFSNESVGWRGRVRGVHSQMCCDEIPAKRRSIKAQPHISHAVSVNGAAICGCHGGAVSVSQDVHCRCRDDAPLSASVTCLYGLRSWPLLIAGCCVSLPVKTARGLAPLGFGTELCVVKT